MLHINEAYNDMQDLASFPQPTNQGEIDKFNKLVKIYNNKLQHISIDKQQPALGGNDLQPMQSPQAQPQQPQGQPPAPQGQPSLPQMGQEYNPKDNGNGIIGQNSPVGQMPQMGSL